MSSDHKTTFLTALKHRPTRIETKGPNEMFGNTYHSEHIRQEIEKANTASRFEVEKITIPRLLLFILYTVSLLIAMNLRVDFSTQFEITTSRRDFYLNNIQMNDDRSKQLSWDRIQDRQTMIDYLRSSLIPSIYESSNYTAANTLKEKAASFESASKYEFLTSLRILQKRSRLVSQPQNMIFIDRWNLDDSLEDTGTYGQKNVNITYNSELEAYNLTFPIPFMTYNETGSQFNQVLDNGFFDTQTRTVQVDFAEYNGYNNMVIFLKMTFEFTPAGRIQKNIQILVFPFVFYSGDEGRLMMAFQIIFVIMFVYFFFQEFIKVYNQIRNAFPMKKDSDAAKSKLEQVTAKAQGLKQIVTTILKGLLNHIKDPWSLLDVFSLTCSLMDIIIWSTLVKENKIGHLFDTLAEGSPASQEAKLAALYMSNSIIEDTVNPLILYRQAAAVNILILIFKMLKYLSRLNDHVKDQVQLLIGILGKLIPFVILLITMVFCYVYMAYFLFGDSIEEFNSYFTSFRYLITNINKDVRQVETMMHVEKGQTIIFNIVLIFIIIFIFTNMFLVYVIHAYRDYFNEKAKEREIKQEEMSNFEFTPSIFWKIKNYFRRDLYLFYLRVSQPSKYQEINAYSKEKKTMEKRELKMYSGFDFNMDITDTSEEHEKLNPIFNTEESINKVLNERKRGTVKAVWTTLSLWAAFVCLTMVSLGHHKITQAQNAAHGIDGVLKASGTLGAGDGGFDFGTSLDKLDNIDYIANWLVELFPKFMSDYDEVELVDGRKLNGHFFIGDKFFIDNAFRITFRRRNLVALKEDTYDGRNNYTYSPIFMASDVDPPGESRETIIGEKTKRVYEYSYEKSFQKAGGYVVNTTIKDFVSILTAVKEDILFTHMDVNSLVLDFVLYQVVTKDAMSVAIIFEADSGFSYKTSIELNFIGLNYYNDVYYYVMGVFELIGLFGTFFAVYKIFQHIKTSNSQYNYWYTMHIANFPELMKRQRTRKCPEFARKLRYIFDFNTVINIFISLLLIAAATLWILYLITLSDLKTIFNKFLQGQKQDWDPNLLSEMEEKFLILVNLRLIESILLLLISIKTLYYYSYFSKFQFLTKTLRKTFHWMPQMAIVLFFVLIGFGFFVQFFKGTSNESYSYFGGMVASQLQNFTKLKGSDKSIFTESYGVFMTIVYYFPWVLVASNIVYNMFLGIVFNTYQMVCEEKKKGHVETGFKDFFNITFEMVNEWRKPNNRQNKAQIYISDQIRNKFNCKKIFDRFDDMVKASVQDIQHWLAGCTATITKEDEYRQNMNRISEELTLKEIEDFKHKSQRQNKILNHEEKLSQFTLKLKLWKYHQYGQEKLLEYMDIFDQKVEHYEQLKGTVKNRIMNKKIDNRIRGYIVELEKQISSNLQEIQLMSKMLEDYKNEVTR